jgi:hypothetical protein
VGASCAVRQETRLQSAGTLARSILEAKAHLHKTVGKVFGWVTGTFGVDDAARSFAEELCIQHPTRSTPR